jgi:hypothetical protein
MKTIEWFGCYADSWQGEITPEAFCHPAKFSRGLIARIYSHMLDSGYIKPGDVIGDTFGGVALGAIHAMLNGLHWRGVELEEKFCTLGNENLALWRGKYGDLLRGTAVLVQGDSRQFLQHVAGIGAVVSSPAYADVINGSGEGPGAYGTKNAAYKKHGEFGVYENKSIQNNNEYGRTAGNLGNMDNDTGATFWQAAAEIVAQAYAALKPGAYAAWVCGDYVRGGERVYFGRQWLELCESVGFVPVEWITAWKTEYKGTQLDIFGNEHEKRIDRVSFFRRLANERNPDAAILNEDVVIVRKPL